MEITNPALRLIPADPSSLSATRSSALIGELFSSRNLVEVVVRQVARNESSSTHHRPGDQRGQTWRVVLQAGDRQLSVLSEQKLAPGQTLQLRRMENGQLQIVGMDNKAPTTPPPPANPELTRRLLDGLRDRQTIQEPAARLIRTLQTLPGLNLSGGASNANASKLPPELVASIRSLLQSLPNSAQVQNSAGLQAAIRESGLLLEARLAAAAERIRSTSMQGGALPEIRRDFKVAVLRLQETLADLARARLSTSSTPENAASRAELERAFNALARMGTAQTATAPTTSSVLAAGAALKSYFGAQQPLGFSLFPAAGAPAASAQAGFSGNSMDLALSTLLRQSAAALARIELQQLHSVAQQQGLAGEPAGGNSLVLEIPVRHGEEVHGFQLIIEEDEHNQDAQDETGHASRTWKVTLRFDFEPLGPMCAELSLLEEKLSARFWTERSATTAIVSSQLSDFRQRMDELGLEFDVLECRNGMPPPRETRFEQALVDIRT